MSEEPQEQQYCVLLKNGAYLWPTSPLTFEDLAASGKLGPMDWIFFEGLRALAMVPVREIAAIMSPEAVDGGADNDDDPQELPTPSPRESGNLTKPGKFSKYQQ